MTLATTEDATSRQSTERGTTAPRPSSHDRDQAPPVESGTEVRSRNKGERRRVDPGASRSEAVPEPVIRRAATADDVDSLEQFVFRHGNYFDSYLATEPGRFSFWSREKRGLVSYTCRGNVVLVGGGLIAPDDHKPQLLKELMDQALPRNLTVAFHNMGDQDLELFRRFGFQVTQWGEEPIIDLGSQTWAGKPYEWVRRQTNFCKRNGVVAFEVRPEELTARQWSRTLYEVLEVAAESLERKPQSEEMKFFEGRIDNHDLGLRRLFVARSGNGTGRIEGFVICNPMHGGTMWATEMYRHRLDSVRGTVACLFHHLMQQLQSEGARGVTMCLDPGFGCETPMPGDSAITRRGFTLAAKYFNFVFDLAGVRHFKSRFRPRYEKRYVFAYPKVTVRSALAFTEVTGLLRLNYRKVVGSLYRQIRNRHLRKNLSDAATAD